MLGHVWRLDSFFWKGVLCLEGSCHSTESQLGRPKLPNVCLSDFHLSALVRVFFRFLVLRTHVSATCKTLLPIVAPMPPIKTSLSSWEFLRMTSDFDYIYIYIYLLHSWYNYYIYAPLTPRHLLRFRPSFASAQVYTFPAADTSPFLPPRVWNKRLTPAKHFWCPSLMTSTN